MNRRHLTLHTIVFCGSMPDNSSLYSNHYSHCGHYGIHFYSRFIEVLMFYLGLDRLISHASIQSISQS